MKNFLYTKKEILGAVFVAVFFITATYFSQRYADSLVAAISSSQYWGMLIYGLFAVIAIVIAPISSLPLVPIAATVWGSFIAAVISLIAWTIGAAIAFILARKYGKKFIAKLIQMENIQRIERKLKPENIFLSVLFLRMIIPVDILSYAVGLFSEMKFAPYLVATIIGMIPFVFFFAYFAQIPFYFQIAILLALIAVIFLNFKKDF